MKEICIIQSSLYNTKKISQKNSNPIEELLSLLGRVKKASGDLSGDNFFD
jgi:hypothetical protein